MMFRGNTVMQAVEIGMILFDVQASFMTNYPEYAFKRIGLNSSVMAMKTNISTYYFPNIFIGVSGFNI